MEIIKSNNIQMRLSDQSKFKVIHLNIIRQNIICAKAKQISNVQSEVKIAQK